MSKRSKEYKRKFTELRTIINAWELIPDSPEDEFDSINHLLLSELYKDADAVKISKKLTFELNDNYGFDVQHDEVSKLTIEVVDWWNNSNEHNSSFKD
ncbi:hypothetical protein KORDIASMS9_00467 [Kordia sp. SMS9]|uniref:hypothetical protein n=1 Tax=Kordia sp. SMS9 TaxID=2282170 RepID=UPI000E0CD1F8|nr:hypothetical protein [Kordia sp. SMS9]AXG68274.1 hypothetical protein KORDIASMS9_00467 [Kordia sp. SMS9]